MGGRHDKHSRAFIRIWTENSKNSVRNGRPRRRRLRGSGGSRPADSLKRCPLDVNEKARQDFPEEHARQELLEVDLRGYDADRDSEACGDCEADADGVTALRTAAWYRLLRRPAELRGVAYPSALSRRDGVY